MNYWHWREQHPSEMEIYKKHLSVIFQELRLDINLLRETEEVRLKAFWEKRRPGEVLAENLLKKKSIEKRINYQYLLSRLQITFTDGREKNITCLNQFDGNFMLSSFVFKYVANIERVDFYPLDDVDGFVRIVKVEGTNGVSIGAEDYVYLAKNQALVCHGILPKYKNGLDVTFIWEGKTIDEYLEKI